MMPLLADFFFIRLGRCSMANIKDPVREKEHAMEASCICLECKADSFRCRGCLRNCGFCRVPERRRDASRQRYCGRKMWWNMPEHKTPRQGSLDADKR